MRDGDRDPETDQKRHWSETYDGNADFFGQEPSELARTALGRFRREGVQTVLELGCGQGRDAIFFAENGLAVTALDYSERAVWALVAAAQERGFLDGPSPRMVVGEHDMREPLPFPDGCFDACYSHMLLCMEFTEEQIAFILGEVYRVLRPGGLHVCSVRSIFDKHARAGIALEGDLRDVDGFVVRFFNESQARRLAAGSEIVEIGRMTEGRLPRDLFMIVFRKPGASDPGSTGSEREGDAMAGPMERFQEFFEAVFGSGVLDAKTKHLVALGAELAATGDAGAKFCLAGAREAGATEEELREACLIAMTVGAYRIKLSFDGLPGGTAGITRAKDTAGTADQPAALS